MKLKKIVSLALAGILAVSMLAGCKGNDDNNSNVNPPVSNVPASAIASALNAKLSPNQADLLSFEANSTLANAISWMNGDQWDRLAAQSDEFVQDADRPTLVKPTNNDEDIENAVIGRVLGSLSGLGPVVEYAWDADENAFDIDVDGSAENANKTYLAIWLVDASVSSVDEIANAVMNGPDDDTLHEMIYELEGAIDDDENGYGFEYKGYAEMVKVTNANSTDSAYAIAVLVNQYVTANT